MASQDKEKTKQDKEKLKNSPKKEKTYPLLEKPLEEWVQSSLRGNINVYTSIFPGVRIKKKNLYTSFRLFLDQKGFHSPLPPKKFLAKLEEALESQKIPFYKHRLHTGYVLHGVEMVEAANNAFAEEEKQSIP